MSQSGLPTKMPHRMEKSSPKNWLDVGKCPLQGKITVRLPFSDIVRGD